MFSNLQDFIKHLEKNNQLARIKTEVNPELEITEIYDRVVKQQGKALLFENVQGSKMPLLLRGGWSSEMSFNVGETPNVKTVRNLASSGVNISRCHEHSSAKGLHER